MKSMLTTLLIYYIITQIIRYVHARILMETVLNIFLTKYK